MHKQKAKELTLEGFHKYGEFSQMLSPDGLRVGPDIHAFFCDRIVYSFASPSPVGFSISRVQKRPVVVDTTEIHRLCGEILMPLDGDVYIHVGPVSDPDEPPFEQFELFRVPKGWMVSLKPGTWHFAAFPCSQDTVDVLVALPERTYANDCVVKKIPEADRLELDG